MTEPLIKLRPMQRRVFRHEAGILALIWRRQLGKSFTLGAIGLDWMMEDICSVFYVSAAIRLGMENIRKEAEIWRASTAALRKLAAQGGRQLLTNADDDRGDLLDVDAVADLFESQKLETKLYHNRTDYSRSIVIAPNPDTAVGWTGHLVGDEVGRMPEFKDLWEAVEPIVSSNPHLRVRLATTPPPDDAHHSYEMLAPMEAEFAPNPEGNFYRTPGGILVHRCDAYDAEQAGIPIYDLATREPLTAEESRRRAPDKTAWDRNYGCQFIRGGTAALSRAHLLHAMALGDREGAEAINVTEQMEAA